MDKYTVDLDKVLNDFEYSELTEQQNNDFVQNTSSNELNFQQAYQKNQIENQNYQKSPLATAKHSINNVFHSLNEYLNTDIKTDINRPSSSFANLQEIDTTIPTIVKINSKDKLDVSSIQDIFKNISKDHEISVTENLNPEKNDSIKTINNNLNFKLDLHNKTNTEIIENQTNEHQESVEDEEEDKQTILKTNDDHVEKETINIEKQMIDIEKQLIDIETDEQCENFDNNKIENQSITGQILSCSDEKIEVMIVETESKPVKFFDQDISDTEIENELAELEIEYQNKIKMEFVNQIDLQTESEVINIENSSVMESTDLETEKLETVNNINNNNNNVEEEDNIKNFEEEEEESPEVFLDTQTEMETSAASDTIEHNLENEVKIEEEENLVIENNTERKNSIVRPNSLELNSESSAENSTINLIGNPGSTPYNNTYISTPKQPETSTAHHQEADPEISVNSLSPTLSESSTYDNSNTDSPKTSDSCNDTSLEEFNQEGTNRNNKNLDETTSERSNAETDQNRNGESENSASGESNQLNNEVSWLGKTAPFWTPDSEALCCLHCNQKFTVIKRRHHCRACGLVLCSKCCNMKYKLEYMENTEARVCTKCYEILTKTKNPDTTTASSSSDTSPENRSTASTSSNYRLNPNNPMEYCSKIPPHQQVGVTPSQPPSVMVPVGVLKRKGSNKSKSSKSVMFCDGIRPGCDLTELDRDFNYKDGGDSSNNFNKKLNNSTNTRSNTRNLPKIDPKTCSYIPSENECLPPIVNILKSDAFYAESTNNNIVDILRNETVTFAIQRNLHVQVKIINMDCCINKLVWCFSTDGMITVGQDEIIILLEFIDNEKYIPKDIFLHLNNIYNDAIKGTSITEMGISIHPNSNFLESKNHAGFLYIKPTFQCIQNVIIPKEPYLIGILIHRWETPWAKIFPLRLLLRLGAEYRYYPSPIISTRHRESVYVEIGHTIINLLADFRNFSYTIPSVRGLTIHMEEKNTTVSIPMNRYDQVMKALNNSSDHILAFSANFSVKADAHLVCIQDTHGNNENSYTTHAINIHNKPRKVTGASFIVLNGALKSSSGLTAKSSIVEDGLMIQILPEQMLKLQNALKNMKNFKINCGCVNAQSDESVSILWTENDINFNVGVLSPIDNMSLSGIPSIRVHNGKDFICNNGNKLIRWTEVFIIQSGEDVNRSQDPIDVSKISENISKATSQALVKYLELLATNSCTKIGIRTTLHVENVSYLAGSNGNKLPPIYMKSLDNELIPVLHRISGNFGDQTSVVLELKFYILNV